VESARAASGEIVVVFAGSELVEFDEGESVEIVVLGVETVLKFSAVPTIPTATKNVTIARPP